MRKHRGNPVTHHIRLLRMTRPFRLNQLSHIPRTPRLWNLAPFENKAQLALAHRVVTGIHRLLIPDERHGSPLEAPSLAEAYRLIQVRRRTPHKKKTIRRANRRNIPRRHLRNRDSRVMPNRTTTLLATHTRMLQLPLVVPRRIGVNDVIPLARKRRIRPKLAPTVPQR